MAAPKLTPELQEELLEAARSGAFLDTVAAACRVPEAWLDEILRLGLTSDAPEPYHSFAVEFAAIEAQLELDVMKATRLAMQVDPNVGFEYLARRFPKKWGPKATQTKTVAELRPTALEQKEQLELLRTLLKNPPESLTKLLEDAGFRKEGKLLK